MSEEKDKTLEALLKLLDAFVFESTALCELEKTHIRRAWGMVEEVVDSYRRRKDRKE